MVCLWQGRSAPTSSSTTLRASKRSSAPPLAFMASRHERRAERSCPSLWDVAQWKKISESFIHFFHKAFLLCFTFHYFSEFLKNIFRVLLGGKFGELLTVLDILTGIVGIVFVSSFFFAAVFRAHLHTVSCGCRRSFATKVGVKTSAPADVSRSTYR